MKIDCTDKNYAILNREIARSSGNLLLSNCLGQRFIGAGASERSITINGIPGNALGAYLDGATITVNGNAQDAAGDTMNDGKIIIHGSCGDACGYAMRGGKIFVQGDVGYRAGIHMKAYTGKTPVLIVGGRSGSFLGEYQAGGIIAVLGLNCSDEELLGQFCAAGMHGGKIFIRADRLCVPLSEQINAAPAGESELSELAPHIDEFCKAFAISPSLIYSKPFFVLTPNSANPYKQLYIQN